MTAILEPLVAARGDEPAVIDGRGTTCWRELDERVTRLVHALRDAGLQTGDSVVALLGNQVELVEVSLACAHGGWLLVPLNWHWVGREIAYVLDDARAAAVIVDERWAPVIAEAVTAADAAPLLCLEVGAADASYESALAASRHEDIADAQRGGPMFYTSGTTGWPKGVRSSLGAVGGPPEVFTLMAHTLGPVIDVPPSDPAPRVQLVCGPMYHSAQWVFGLFALACGATIVLQHRFDAAEVLRLVDAHGVTNVHLVPTQMKRLLDLPDEERAAFGGTSLRTVLHGAAPCAPAVKRAMIDWVGPIVTEYYGGTEGGFLAMASSEDWLARPGTVGRPVPIIEIEIVGPTGEPLPTGEHGEVWFRNLLGSDFEYHNAPEKTASAHRAGGLGTLGDIGYLDAEGFLYLSDRKIDLVVSGGVNIYPAEIEGVLVEHEAIADVAVFGIPDDDMGESVHAAVALREGHEWNDETEADLVAFCRERLAGYKRPRSFEVHGELPRSEAGKLTKRVLRDRWWVDRDRRI